MTKTVNDTLRNMLDKKTGYRTEGYGGSGERDLIDVVTFEIFEFCNRDILEWLILRYGGFEYLDFLDKDDKQVMDGLFSFEKEILRDIQQLVEGKLGSYPKLTVWLTSKEELYYYKRDNDDYDKYSFHEMEEEIDFMVISSLGDQGSLFAFKEHPTIENIY